MAAVRIPQYQQQVATPGGEIAGAQGRGISPFNIETGGFQRFEQDLKRAREETDINNANAEISAEEPRAQLALATKFNDVTTAWTPDQKPVPEQMFEFIDQYRAEAETRITNPRAKQLMAERANKFKTQYGLEGFAFQQKAEVDLRVGTYESTYQNIADLSSTNPSLFAGELARANAVVMQDSQIPARMKDEFIRKQSQAAAMKVAKAQSELNPHETFALANALLGVSEPVLKMPAGTASDLYADIARVESGGRLYDDAGKILRGPAITKADGSTEFAYGRYQLLEGSAKKVAGDLGMDWKPDVFFRERTGNPQLDAETDQYHEALGRGYIDEQQQSFGGNPILVAAAHNMGAGATKGWAMGVPYQTQSGKWWYPKQPMDMAAMPTETRKYIEKLGPVSERKLDTVVNTAAEDATAFRLLSTEDLIAVRGAAQSNLAELQRQRDAANAINKDLFKSRITDIEVAAKNGDAVQIPPDDELLTYLGPAQAALTKQRLMGYQSMAGALKRLPGLSNAELQATADMPDPAGADDRENRQFIRDTVAKQATTILAERKADPGKASMSSEMVQTAYSGYVSASQAVQQAGKQVTPEQLDQLNTAKSNFFKASFAQQRQWGIAEPKLPAAVVEDIATGFRTQFAGGDVTSATMRMQNLPRELGSFDAIQQVGNKTGDLGWFAMEGVPPETMTLLHAATIQKPDEMAKLLPDGVKKTDVEKAVAVAFAPLTQTFSVPDIDGAGDAVTAGRYLNGGKALATQYLVSGQASSAKEAATMAYQALYAEREAVVDGYRVPRNFEPAKVQEGLRRRLQNLPPAAMYLRAPAPGLTEGESRTNILRNVQKNGRWVTNETGDGVYLMVAGRPALDAAGKPIWAAFSNVVTEPEPTADRARAETAANRFRYGRQ